LLIAPTSTRCPLRRPLVGNLVGVMGIILASVVGVVAITVRIVVVLVRNDAVLVPVDVAELGHQEYYRRG